MKRYVSPRYPAGFDGGRSARRAGQQRVDGVEDVWGVKNRRKVNGNLPIFSFPNEGAVSGPDIGPINPGPTTSTVAYVEKLCVTSEIRIAEPVVREYWHVGASFPQSHRADTLLTVRARGAPERAQVPSYGNASVLDDAPTSRARNHAPVTAECPESRKTTRSNRSAPRWSARAQRQR
jgi:hypothetical protein